MRRLLSILSFNTIKIIPKLTKAFYWSILWLACLMFIYIVLLKPFIIMHTTAIGQLITCLNNNLNDNNNRNEFVIFLGSSRLQSAINTNALANMSQVKNVTFINLSLPSNGPWHYLTVLRNSKTPLNRVKLIVLEISPWMFNANALYHYAREKSPSHLGLDQWGTIHERVEIADISERIRAMTISMVPRKPLSEYISALKKSKPVFELPGPGYHLNQLSMKKIRDDPNFMAENISKKHLYKFEFLQSEANILVELIKELDSSGVAVSLVHPPVRREYYNYLDTDPIYSANFEKYKTFIKSFSNNHQVIYWETPPDAGLDNSIFIDYGHLSKEGAILFTNRLSTEILQLIK